MRTRGGLPFSHSLILFFSFTQSFICRYILVLWKEGERERERERERGEWSRPNLQTISGIKYGSMSQLRYTILDCHRIERVFYRVLVVYFAYFKNCCLIIALNRTKLNRVELKTIMGRTNTNTSLHVHPKYAAGRKHGRLASITICSCVEYIYLRTSTLHRCSFSWH